jgi:hypothetical protein
MSKERAEVDELRQRKKELSSLIHEAYKGTPNYKLIEKYSKEMHKVDARLYFLETGKEEPGQ